MRWVLGLVCFVGCGGIVSATSDAGVDGNLDATCTSDASCTGGLVCAYPVSDGCGATKHCLPPPNSGACKAMPYCACDGTMVSVCSAGAPKPVAHAGPCADVTNPDTCKIACEQCDVSAFTPTTLAKPIVASNACSSSEIDSFVAACLSSGATQTTCSPWLVSDAGACAKCLFTQISAPTWGPIVCTSSSCSLDPGGCIDATLGQVSKETSSGGSGSCGDLYNAEDDCVAYACGACTSGSDFTTCSNDAMASACKSYVDAANASNGPCASLDAGATACFPQTDSQYAAFVNVFCGTGP